MFARPARTVALVLAALTAVGCSTATGATDATSSPLTVMLADDWASSPAVVDAITDFEEQHDIRVVVRPVTFSQLEEFMIADRTGPREVDVSQWHAFAAGALEYALPVTERFAATYDEGTFLPGAMADVTWDGQTYGVPLDVNAVVLIVNTDLLARIGHDVDDMATWDGVRTVAASAAEHDVRLTYLPASTWSTFAWLRANGGLWFELEDGHPRMLFDSPPVLEMMEFLTDLTADDGRMAYPADSIDTSADAYPLFHDQQTLALASGTWDVARLVEDDPGFEWTVLPMPQGPSADGPGTVLGGSSLYVTQHATDPALAWEFSTHMVRPAYALRYAKEHGRLPGRTDVLADPFFADERYQVAVDQLPHATPMRLVVYPRVLDLATRSIQKALNHTAPTTPEFVSLQERATRLVAAIHDRED